MSTVTGIIEKAHQNDRGYWSILVNGTWYGTYKSDYTNLEGQNVTFEGENKGQYYNVKGKVSLADGAAPARAAGPARTNAVAAPATAQAGVDRQQSIVLQSSYKTASDILNVLLANDILSVPAKKADKYDFALGMLDELALRLYARCIDPATFLSDHPVGPQAEKADEYNPAAA